MLDTIRELREGEEPPYDLLLLADPSRPLVDVYLSKGICCVAEYRQEIIGVVVLLETDEETMEIMNIAVAEQHQGKGIGKALIAAAVQAATDHKAKVLEIGTGNSGIQQLYLYQRSGFRIVGVDLDFFTRNYDEPIFENGIPCRDMIRLRMELTQPIPG